MNDIQWEQLMNLIKLKKENPKEYRQLLEDLTGIIKDMQEVLNKASEVKK